MSGGGGADSPPSLQFLCLDSGEEYGVLLDEEISLLLSIQLHDRQRLLAKQSTSEESYQIEFGCASEVFNSITTGHFKTDSAPVNEKALPPRLNENQSSTSVNDDYPKSSRGITQQIEDFHIDFEQEAEVDVDEDEYQESAASKPATTTSDLTASFDCNNQAGQVYEAQVKDGIYAENKSTKRPNIKDEHQQMEVSNQEEKYSSEKRSSVTFSSYSIAPPQVPSTVLSFTASPQTKQLSEHGISYSCTPPPRSLQHADLYNHSVGQSSPIQAPMQHPGAQHIHINHYTANLTYLPVVSSANTVQPVVSGIPNSGLATRQPVPFATYPLNYVAPFPQSTTTPPMFTSTPFPPPMVIYPPGHSVQFSMYPPPPTGTGMDPNVTRCGQETGIVEDCDTEKRTATPVVSLYKSTQEKDDNANKAKQYEETESPVVYDSFESRTKESQPCTENIEQSSARDNQIKVQEEQELANLYEKGKVMNMTNSLTSSTTSSCSTNVRHLEEKVLHQPTPPPFPLPPDSGDNDIENGKSKSWASLLFSGTDPSVERINVDKPMARIPPFSSTKEESKPVPVDGQTVASTQEQLKLGEFLKSYELNHASASIVPRGLTNRSNWCFVNAILQALLACPSFYNLFKNLPKDISLSRAKSITPMLDAVVEFVNEFNALEVFGKHQKKDKGRKRDHLIIDISFEPNYVYNVLMQSKSMDEGRQEDAEEFLSYLLNVLDEEMRSLIKMTQAGDDAGNYSAEWQYTQAKSCVTRRVMDQTTTTRTPIQALFAGLTRSSVIAEHCETSATLQPFFTLQLDIQTNTLHNLQQVLEHNFAVENLEEYRNPRSGQLGAASKTLSLEELPPIMILHLKRMVHDGFTEQKVMKKIDFPVDLLIAKSILSGNCKTKYTIKQKSYKLFAVVYHNGKEAIKGHYITDIYHTGYCCWLRCNDSSVSMISEEEVTTPLHNSTPYILFYRQRETMGGVDRFKNSAF